MTSTTDICCIGHITLDKIVTPKMTVYMPGGTSFYFANAISRLPHEGFQLVTAVGESELGAVEKIRGLGVDVKTLPSRKSVYFESRLLSFASLAYYDEHGLSHRLIGLQSLHLK